MGVFGEKHTSLTREQKRQLIHQADTHKLRPTEVCDWVLATWGLRIARVTVYSILHKQRASLMAGHKDLYQSMQNSINGLQQPASSSSSSSLATTASSSTSIYTTSNEACLERNKSSGRISKSTGRSVGKRARSTSSSLRGSSVASDLSSTVPLSYEAPTGEGARWEGQLKRVREPASVELDRAMVEFLKSSEAVDAHGRRLNDAELQSHALRLARGIPSAARMRCSFGWLRHFKRRLGVQWATDRLGRYRWIIEMDQGGPSSAPPPLPAAASTAAERPAGAADAHNNYSHRHQSHHRHFDQQHSALPQRQGKAKQEQRITSHPSSTRPHVLADHTGEFVPQTSSISNDDDEEEEEEEYHSSHELFGKDFDLSSPLRADATPTHAESSKHARSSSISTTSTSTSVSSASPSYATSSSYAYPYASSFANQLQAFASRTLYPFSESSSPYASLGPYSILSSATTSSSSTLAPHYHQQSLPTSSLAHPSHSTFLNLGPSTLCHQQPHHQQQQPHLPSILDSLPSLFESLPPLSSTPPTSSSHHNSLGSATNNSLTSPQLLLNHTSATINHERDNFYSQQQQQSSTPLTTTGGNTAGSSFGMGVDGGMKKVPSKDEAYDMLQSLLLYYEQDHHHLGEQQTLLLPRWIHQQRQIMNQSDENDVRMLWMKHQQFQQQQQQQQHSLSHPHSNYSRSTVSPPPMPPTTTASESTSSVKMTTSIGTSTSQDREEAASATSTNSSAGLNQYGSSTNCGSNNISGSSSLPSLTSSIEQQMLFAHQQVLQQQYALHQQQQQQRQQQQPQQSQQQSSYLLHRPSTSQ